MNRPGPLEKGNKDKGSWDFSTGAFFFLGTDLGTKTPQSPTVSEPTP
jgi:hypothetical protein